MNTGDKYDSLPAGLPHINAVIFERVAVLEEDDMAEYSENPVEDYIMARVRDLARSLRSPSMAESTSTGSFHAVRTECLCAV